MRSFAVNQCILLKNNRLINLFFLTLIFIFLLPPCVGISSDPNSPINENSRTVLAGGNNAVKGSTGPTMIMRYSKEKSVKNPIASFAYFVPLIAPTLVDNISSVNNKQQVAIVSYKITSDVKSFHVSCEFEILGDGFHMNTFDPAGMIAAQTDVFKKGQAMTNMLDYIKFDGNGFGIIEVKGAINGSAKVVTGVNVKFNARGGKSPVTIGLYDIEPKDGEYKYENRSNQLVARVNTLSFKKTENANPRMGIKVASISNKAESGGFLSSLKGKIANLLIKPPKVDKLGNTTMLEFGYALLQKNTAFTFPLAKNIKESRVVK